MLLILLPRGLSTSYTVSLPNKTICKAQAVTTLMVNHSTTHVKVAPLKERLMQLINTNLLTPSSTDSRRNGVPLSMTNRIIPRGEVIDLKISIIVCQNQSTPIKQAYNSDTNLHHWISHHPVVQGTNVKNKTH